MGINRDKRNYLSKLSWGKATNFISLFFSYFLSKFFKKPFIKALPTAISIEPTTSCNLRCPECPSGLRSFTRPTGMLNQSTFQSVIDQLAKSLTQLTFYFQGEPYLNPEFLDMVAYANRQKIYTVTSTNAHYLDDENARKTVESGLDRLIVSIDGTTQETYESYRIGGKLETVIEGTKNIIKWKKELKSQTPYVVFQFLVVKPNEHQIEEGEKLTKELGVDEIQFKTAQIYDFEDGSPLIPSIDKYSRYKKGKDGKYKIKNKLLNSCWKMWQSCVITWDGKVVPCCFDKDAKYQLGDMSKEKFSDIWLGKEYNQFRQAILHSRSEIDICTNCTEGTKVFA